MHDISDLEQRGLPGVMVASEGFVSATQTQADALGFGTIARAFTPHPVQDRTDDEMREYADSVFDSVIEQLTTS